MFTKSVTISGTSAVSVYDLVKSVLPASSVEAVDNFNQQLKFNILFQVGNTNTGVVYIGDATNQAFQLVKTAAATATNQWEFKKQSLTDTYVKGTNNDVVVIVLLPCSE